MKGIKGSSVNPLWCLRENKVLPMTLLPCELWVWVVSVLGLGTCGESRNTDGGLATAFLAKGDSPHSRFDKSQLLTPFALGTQAFMSLFSSFLPATAVAASHTSAFVCDSCLSQLADPRERSMALQRAVNQYKMADPCLVVVIK